MTKALDNDFLPSKDNKFIPYRSFLNLEEGKKLEELLEQKNIPHVLDIAREKESISSSIMGEGIHVKAVLKILAQDFKRVDMLIAEEIKKISFEDLKEHPLYTCSDKDLYEILIKPDEWNIENITLAQIILSNRGKNVSEEEIVQLRLERINEIRKGKKGSKWVIISTAAIIISDFFDGKITLSIIGIGVGIYYTYAKSHDINGESYYEYDDQTRQIGKAMLWSSILFFVVKVFVLFYLYR